MPFNPNYLTGPNKKQISVLDGYCKDSACGKVGRTAAVQPGIPVGDNFKNFSQPPKGSRISDNKLGMDPRCKLPIVGNGYTGYIPGKRDGEAGLGKAPWKIFANHFNNEVEKVEYRGLQLPKYSGSGREIRSVGYHTKIHDLNYFDKDNVRAEDRRRRALGLHPSLYNERGNDLLEFEYLASKHREFYRDRLGGPGVRRINHFHYPDPRADQTEVAAYKYGHFPQIHFTDSSMKGLQQTDCGSQKI